MISINSPGNHPHPKLYVFVFSISLFSSEDSFEEQSQLLIRTSTKKRESNPSHQKSYKIRYVV